MRRSFDTSLSSMIRVQPLIDRSGSSWKAQQSSRSRLFEASAGVAPARATIRISD